MYVTGLINSTGVKLQPSYRSTYTFASASLQDISDGVCTLSMCHTLSINLESFVLPGKGGSSVTDRFNFSPTYVEVVNIPTLFYSIKTKCC